MRILMAEDNRVIADRMAEFLKAHGYTVVVERSRSRLRARIEKDKAFDLIVLDLLLGRGDCIEHALDNIKAIRSRNAFVPILVFTEHAQKEWIDQVKNVGATDLVRKPPSVTEDYFTSVFLPKIQEIELGHIAFDFQAISDKLRALSEDALIKRVVVPLFRHMNYNLVSPVAHHGPGEYGMDILPFYDDDKMGMRNYYAAQVKAGDIHAKAGKSGHVQSIIHQAEAAIRKKFLDIDNLPRNIDKVFLICSGNITPDARQSLDDWLGENNTRAIVIDGNKLVNLLLKHQLIYLLDSERHPPIVDILPCRLDTYGEKVASWEQLLKIVVSKALGVDSRAAKTIYKEILERERKFPTLVGDKFALPHTYDRRIERHRVVLCVSSQAYDWAVFDPSEVRYVVLCVFADESKMTGAIRRAVGTVLKESIPAKPYSSTGVMGWLHKTQAMLADFLSMEDFKVNSLPVMKMKTGRYPQTNQ
jgi:CheY-like chemotaxis protein/mannitol/fructose-specific phosphotransferase system IIA component (Ntr-type)